MILEDYTKLREELTEFRLGISDGKRKDYTKSSEDVLKNFKNQAEALGVTPMVSLAVHMEKQFASILNYIKTNGQSESEPIKNRISDCLNYLELLWGLLNDLGYLETGWVDVTTMEKQHKASIYDPNTFAERYTELLNMIEDKQLRRDVLRDIVQSAIREDQYLAEEVH